MTLTPGSRLGPYEILAPLGAGGMGEVYRARDTRLHREIAIKVLPTSFSQDPDRLRRFEQEARAASALNHPSIMTIHDVGTQEGVPYVVSELLEGETLRRRLAAGALPARKAVEYAIQIAHGLAAAHEKGIVHRDLKPENVFLTRDGRAKILDFGLAKLTPPLGSTSQTNLPTAALDTEPGMILGTLSYMSPEQVRGRPADARSDIFAFGVTFYEMLTGQRAFHGDTAADTVSAILTKDVPALSPTNREISPGLDRIVRRCLEKDPGLRFQSAHDVAFDLEYLSDASGAPQPFRPARSWKRIAFPIAVAAVLAAAGLLWWRRSSGAGAAFDSIAVLPFANASRDPETDYLSDGITESIINSLSRLPQLRVTARSSAFRYKGRDDDPQGAGRELKVRAVVSGKVLQREDRLTVQADLVDVRRGSQVWGDRYDRKLSDILSMQEEIAREISEKLKLRLTGEEKESLRKRHTSSTEAYRLYLRGRYEWEKRTADGLQKSSEFFQKAIEKDPAFALAYSGLADAYAVLPSNSLMAPADALSRARAAARKALEIDQSLATAHATLGLALASYDHDWSAAEREFKRAIELDPSYATARFWYQLLLSAHGRWDEALSQIEEARDIDPFSGIVQASVVRALTYARRYDRAIEEGRKVLRDNPNFAPAHSFLGFAYAASGQIREAAAEFRRAADLIGQGPHGAYHRGYAQALSGQRGEALRTIEELKNLAAGRYVPPSHISVLFTALGEKDKAFEWLERACEDRSFDIIFLGVDPRFDSLRSDPRFPDLLRKVGLTPRAP